MDPVEVDDENKGMYEAGVVGCVPHLRTDTLALRLKEKPQYKPSALTTIHFYLSGVDCGKSGLSNRPIAEDDR